MKKFMNELWKTGRKAVLSLLACLLVNGIFLISASAAQTPIRGIDVSRWQGKIDWAKVKKAGIEYVMLGSGYYKNGEVISDPNFKYNIEHAIENDVKVGIYIYSFAKNVSQAKAEAQYVLDLIDGYKISYPVAFDIEDVSQNSLSRTLRTDMVLAFMDVIEKEGYHPMVYASQNYFLNMLELDRLKGKDLWVAIWKGKPSLSSYAMWQYSSTGRVSGIDAPVDLDYCYIDYSKTITPRTKRKSRDVIPHWVHKGPNYWYITENGSRVRNSFREIDGKTYYFDQDGYRVYKLQTIAGKKYFFSNKGIMKTGWVTIDKARYYFSKETGEMKSGWVKDGKKKYFCTKTSGVKLGWFTLKGDAYYAGKDGAIATGWKTILQKRYHFSSTGVMDTGWLTFGGKRYYLNKKGIMKTGWLTLENKYYYFDSQGVLQTGWKTIRGERYLFDRNGVRISGWVRSGEKYYYMDKDGKMLRNTKFGEYEFDENGICLNR